MLRRSVETILVAHKMDPGRRELYVEGTRDRSFLNWLVGGEILDNASVVVIDSVEMQDVEYGGNRERLKKFLLAVLGTTVDIRGLIDSDHAILEKEEMPSNAWVTDFRDAEGYVLGHGNIDVALRVGFGIERAEAKSVHSSMRECALYFAALRVVSRDLDLCLPVSDLKFSKFVKSTREGKLTVDRGKLATSLLQAAGVSLARLAEIEEAVIEREQHVRDYPAEMVCHGKDCMKLLSIQFKALGAEEHADVAPVIWATFRRESLENYPNLAAASRYLTKPAA